MKQSNSNAKIPNYSLNNAQQVINNLQSKEVDSEYPIIREKTTFGGVNISDANIHNNSTFIANLWD